MDNQIEEVRHTLQRTQRINKRLKDITTKIKSHIDNIEKNELLWEKERSIRSIHAADAINHSGDGSKNNTTDRVSHSERVRNEKRLNEDGKLDRVQPH